VYRALVVALASCSAPPAPTVANHAPAIATGCPFTGHHNAVWLHELFPGCPTMPFNVDFPMCLGECPRPCRSHTGEMTTTYHYDANGHWLDTTDAAGTDSCAYANGRIASCGDGYEQWSRGADGRIAAILMGEKHEAWMTVRYDDRGDAVELVFPGFDDTQRFRYGADHRLLAHEHVKNGNTEVFTYEHDRLISRGDDNARSTYAYDDRGRLTRVDNTQWPVGPAPNALVTFDYDAQGRVVRIIEHSHRRSDTTTTFDYCLLSRQ
jgi:YD repeat-containing protein